jgi:hypothetical protein
MVLTVPAAKMKMIFSMFSPTRLVDTAILSHEWFIRHLTQIGCTVCSSRINGLGCRGNCACMLGERFWEWLIFPNVHMQPWWVHGHPNKPFLSLWSTMLFTFKPLTALLMKREAAHCMLCYSAWRPQCMIHGSRDFTALETLLHVYMLHVLLHTLRPEEHCF